MEKPENYSYYINKKNHIPYRDWPKEVRDYKNWQRRIRMNPKWANLSDEERKAEHRKVQLQAAENMRRKMQNKTPDELVEINKRKGSFYSNMSDEEKVVHNKTLRNRSKQFWDNMTAEERKEFGQYRWNLKSDEEKAVIIERFNQAGIDRMKNLPQEEIHQVIENMNRVRLNKFYSDPEFREHQMALLEQHRLEYLNSLSDSEKIMVLKDNHLNRKFENKFMHSDISEHFYLEKELKVNINNSIKFWDYGIYDRSNDKLVMVVDLDGSFYHGDCADYNGLHSKEERDEKRGYFIPDEVKACIIEESTFSDGFKLMVSKLIMDYPNYLISIFHEMRSLEFPYPCYHHNELIRSMQQLIRLDPNNKYLKLSTRNREGDRLINHFHHSIYHAHRIGELSPYDAWYNDELLMKCIKNRILYRTVIDSNKILQGFNVSKIAPKVSVFSAGRAKILIHRYLFEFDEIFDPFSGFSGRMLGAISLDKKYIGQDISEIHIKESIRLLEFLEMCKTHFPDIVHPYLQVADILGSSGEYECLFTCPPYGDKEQWWKIPITKTICDEWIDICLERFKCKKYLFVVDHTEKYVSNVVDVISNKSHFGTNNEYVIMIDGRG